jgi:hypothetical protein
MTFEQYQDYVNNYIATNGRNAITGNVMNVILQEIGEMLYSEGGGDITIGTTPIVSGVAGRILFEGADNVVRQSADLHWDSSNNRLGINTNTPECTLDVRSQGTSNRRGIQVTHYDNTTAFSQAKVIGRRARGSVGSPSAVLANDSIASFNGSAYKETGWSDTLGGMYIYARQNFTDSATGTFITFRGVANGSTTVSEWVRINSTGMAIGWGGTDPRAVLDVKAQLSDASHVVFRIRNSLDTLDMLKITGDTKFRFFGNIINTLLIEKGVGNNIHIHNFPQSQGNNSSLIIGNKTPSGGFGSSNPAVIINPSDLRNLVIFHRNIMAISDEPSSTMYGAFGTNSCVFAMKNSNLMGGNPTGSFLDHFAMYSADIVAGNAAPHFRTENGSIIKLYQQYLPTSPTTGEIATLLSNLGLANLI